MKGMSGLFELRRIPVSGSSVTSGSHQTKGQDQMVAEISQDRMYMLAGVRSSLEWVDVSELLIDETYQRPVRDHHINRIVKNFDPDMFGTLIVSARKGGGMYVVDGQHRVEAVKRMGWGDQRVPCVVYHGMTVEEEARAFFYPQSNRVQLVPAERFKARLAAGDESAVNLVRKVESYGYGLNLTMGSSDSTRTIDAISAVERLSLSREDILSEVLTTCRAAWGHDQFKLTNPILTGLGRFIYRYWGVYDRNRLTIALRNSTPGRVEGDGRDYRKVLGGKGDDATGRAILHLYNHKLKQHRLPEWDVSAK